MKLLNNLKLLVFGLCFSQIYSANMAFLLSSDVVSGRSVKNVVFDLNQKEKFAQVNAIDHFAVNSFKFELLFPVISSLEIGFNVSLEGGIPMIIAKFSHVKRSTDIDNEELLLTVEDFATFGSAFLLIPLLCSFKYTLVKLPKDINLFLLLRSGVNINLNIWSIFGIPVSSSSFFTMEIGTGVYSQGFQFELGYRMNVLGGYIVEQDEAARTPKIVSSYSNHSLFCSWGWLGIDVF